MVVHCMVVQLTGISYLHVLAVQRIVYNGEYHTPPWGGFPSSIARQPRGCQYRTIRLRNALGEMFPTPTFLTPTLFQPWRYQPWIIGPGLCVIDTVVYGTLTAVRPSQAFHDAICECRIMFAIFSTVAYRTCTEAGSRLEVSLTPGAVI